MTGLYQVLHVHLWCAELECAFAPKSMLCNAWTAKLSDVFQRMLHHIQTALHLQEASETSGSMDEEKEAQEEVQRLDSGLTCFMM